MKINGLTLFIFILSIYFLFIQYQQKKENTDYGEIVMRYKQSVKNWPKPTIDSHVKWQELEGIEWVSDYYDIQDQPEVILGKILFFDPKLSSSNQISCSSCHNPELGWTDHLEVSVGNDHLLGKRNTQSLFNIVDRKTYFWDGRAKTLEQQLLGPLSAHHEMNINPTKIPNKLKKFNQYKKLFKDAYGDDNITFNRIAKALVSFQKTIKSQQSKFDKFILGDYTALNDKEIYGLHIFRTKARCMNCHFGKNFTDESFHNIGLTYYQREYEDLGLYHVTKRTEDVGKFKTPSLRDLLYTRPWMHNGLMDDLEGIISLYNSGMQVVNPTEEEKRKDPMYPVTDSLMKPLNLNLNELEALVAFLESLSGSYYKMPRPEIPR